MGACASRRAATQPAASAADGAAASSMDQRLLRALGSLNNKSRAPVPASVLGLVDQLLRVVESRPARSAPSFGRGSAPSRHNALPGAGACSQPYTTALPALALAFAACRTTVGHDAAAAPGSSSDGEAWHAVGSAATTLLSAGSGLAYVGPVFVLFALAVRQWSTFSVVPAEAKDMLQACRDLLWDLNQAWPQLTGQPGHSSPGGSGGGGGGGSGPRALSAAGSGLADSGLAARLHRWVRLMATVAAECFVLNSKGAFMRFALAQQHESELQAKARLLADLRSQLATLLAQAQADKIDQLLTQTLQLADRLAPSERRILPLPGKEGQEELLNELLQGLLLGGGVNGLLLWGLGGCGKSTISRQLGAHLETTAAFAGGTYSCCINSEVQYSASADALITAQQALLAALARRSVTRHGSVDEGAELLRAALMHAAVQGPVLLLIDNVPEGGEGIGGMLPDGLESCLADGSRVIFTSRNKSAQGLQLADVTRRQVQCLRDEAAARVLTSGGLKLTPRELRVALSFCGGLPLALVLVNRALRAAAGDGRAGLQGVLKRLRARSAVGHDKQQALEQRLQFSIDLLSQELRAAFLDIALLCGGMSSADLSFAFGREALRELEARSLITLHAAPGGPHVHDVLRMVAAGMTGPGSPEFRLRAKRSEDLELLAPGTLEGRCIGVDALRVPLLSVSQLPAQHLQHVRVLRAYQLHELGTLLQHARNLRILQAWDVSQPQQPQPQPQPQPQLQQGPTHLPQLRTLELWGVDQAGCTSRTGSSVAAALASCRAPLLEKLLLDSVDASKLPAAGLVLLTSLRILQLHNYRCLGELPASLPSALSLLQELSLRQCCSLRQLPAGLGELRHLTSLVLDGCSGLHQLPASTSALSRLVRLDLRGCYNLASLPSLLHMQLTSMQLDGCAGLASLPELTSCLVKLSARGCGLVGLPVASAASSLQRCDLSNCQRLLSLPASLGAATGLQTLTLAGCARLQALPASCSQLVSLEALVLRGCVGLATLPPSWPTALSLLDLRGCVALATLPPLGPLSRLQSLRLDGATALCDAAAAAALMGLPNSIQLDLRGHQLLSMACGFERRATRRQKKKQRVGTAKLGRVRPVP